MERGSRVFITGMGGFAGGHLARRLLEKAEVWGLDVGPAFENASAIRGANAIECDLLDYEKTVSALERARPRYIVHLAAQSATSISFADPSYTLKTNIFSTLNLFEAALRAAPGARIINAGSGDVYGGAPPSDPPVSEAAELRPANSYAVSKAAADMLAFQYWKARSLDVIRCRPFNHIGPGQSDRFAASAFARQIAEMESGVKKDRILKTGNLEASRDFLHVGDLVRAYELLLDRGRGGEAYNICSGRAVRIRAILETLLSFSDENIEVVEDPSRLRPGEPDAARGDFSKLKALGWAPELRVEDGLRALLDYWREKIGGRAA